MITNPDLDFEISKGLKIPKIFAGVTMAGQEVGSETTATLSCVITDVTGALTVSWLKSSGETIVTGGGFTQNPGRFNIRREIHSRSALYDL